MILGQDKTLIMRLGSTMSVRLPAFNHCLSSIITNTLVQGQELENKLRDPSDSRLDLVTGFVEPLDLFLHDLAIPRVTIMPCAALFVWPRIDMQSLWYPPIPERFRHADGRGMLH